MSLSQVKWIRYIDLCEGGNKLNNTLIKTLSD